MNRVFCIIGKSASGKDKLYARLMERDDISLRHVVMYTTRPIRDKEENGREYFFTTQEDFRKALDAGRVIEYRVYDTYYGKWYYYTMDDGQIDLTSGSYLMIGTLETYAAIRDRFGAENVIPLYIEVEDGERLMRAIQRERKQKTPKYEEMCRRFLADQEDFSEEKIAAAGITKRFENREGEMDRCLAELAAYIHVF